jgi:LacI family transcriptional regulator
MQKRRSIALLVETSNAYCRGLLEGILDYAQRQGNWSVLLPEQERGATPPVWLSRWQGDGIIARIETESIASALRKIKIPIVDLSAARYIPGIPWAETDDDAITRLAIEHFMERGFSQMAYCGDPGFEWSGRRCKSFREHARSRGLVSYEFATSHRYDSEYSVDAEKAKLSKWLQTLPRPIAIMACYDLQARLIVDVCREMSISVPEEIAVLGVDNDRLLCEFATPPLSSIIPDTKRTGFEAAMLLDKMISGEPVQTERLLTRPLGVCTRQSTDILAIEDREIAVAMQYIREHANHNIRISDVLRQVSLSRRVFEARFQKALGRTPHEEIQRLRINRVKQLLAQPELTIAEIAKLAGYEHAEYMAAAFKRETGKSPSEMRRWIAQEVS